MLQFLTYHKRPVEYSGLEQPAHEKTISLFILEFLSCKDWQCQLSPWSCTCKEMCCNQTVISDLSYDEDLQGYLDLEQPVHKKISQLSHDEIGSVDHPQGPVHTKYAAIKLLWSLTSLMMNSKVLQGYLGLEQPSNTTIFSLVLWWDRQSIL